MGRVYKALVRAERWSERDPIGRAAPDDQPANPAGNARNGFAVESEIPRSNSASNEFAAEAVLASRAFPAAVPAPLGRRLRPSLESKPQPAAIAPAVVFQEPGEVYDISDLGFDQHLAALAGSDALAAERYRTLATRLLGLIDRLKLRTLLVTSAEASEGKTTVAINIAWTLAKRPGRRVLLLEANAEPGALYCALGLKTKRNPSDSASELVRLDPNGLYVLTQPAQPETALAKWAPQFDLTVVDSASILGSVDTQHLTAALDGTVIVARAGRTCRSKVNAARKLVPKSKRLGLVLNESDFETERSVSGKREKSLFRGKG